MYPNNFSPIESSADSQPSELYDTLQPYCMLYVS